MLPLIAMMVFMGLVTTPFTSRMEMSIKKNIVDRIQSEISVAADESVGDRNVARIAEQITDDKGRDSGG